MKDIKFSLIIGTLDRYKAIQSCMQSIHHQKYTNYEVIVIDQSSGNETESYFSKINDFRVKYFHVTTKGLSRARNEALKYISGDYICLIDDDAYYLPDYLDIAAKRIEEKGNNIYSGYIWDTVRKAPFVNYNYKRNGKPMSLRECIRLCPSAALFLPAQMLKQVGGFDEQLGVGSVYGAAEETDLLVRGYRIGYKVIFDKNMKLKHPVPVPVTSDKNAAYPQKMMHYYRGFGAFYKKNLFNGKCYSLLPCFLESYGKLILKKLMPFRYNNKLVDGELSGFLYGLRNYVS